MIVVFSLLVIVVIVVFSLLVTLVTVVFSLLVTLVIVVFSWLVTMVIVVFSLLVKGYKRFLTFEDLPDILESDKASAVFPLFESGWARQGANKPPSNR